MIAVGIDLGGTKIEAQVFAPDWSITDRHRVPTPAEYDALVEAISDQIAWAHAIAGSKVPVGISAAGLVNPATELAFTANLCATGKPLPADIERAAACPVTYLNDCRAMTLSETLFGAARGASPVVGLILGTGVGGGVTMDGRLISGPSTLSGEFGHVHAPAHLITRYALPDFHCGCGHYGCIESYISGPGMTRIAKCVTGQAMTPPDIAAARNSDEGAARIWNIWCQIVAELMRSLVHVIDPEVIVLGGGLSQIEGVVDALSAALSATRLSDFAIPRIVLAEGGDASGARGAAFVASQIAGEFADV